MSLEATVTSYLNVGQIPNIKKLDEIFYDDGFPCVALFMF